MPSMTLTCRVCNEPMEQRNTSKPQGEAAHNRCRATHGASMYRKGCRCEICRSANNERMKRYMARRTERDGFHPSKAIKRKARGLDPLASIDCVVCDKPLMNVRQAQAANPMHKECRETPLWKREGLPSPAERKAARAAAKAVSKVPRDLRSDIRAGYEDGDYQRFLRGVERSIQRTEAGCWEWQRRIKDGYPVVQFQVGKKRASMFMHRLVIEAREGKPLGVLAAHHMCGNSKCVNPDHLQPITHRENVAEMLTRTSLEARIEELEAALAAISPNHPILNRVSHLNVA